MIFEGISHMNNMFLDKVFLYFILLYFIFLKTKKIVSDQASFWNHQSVFAIHKSKFLIINLKF